MALQRISGAPAALSTTQLGPVSSGPALSTRETTSRPFIELGIMFGQALGGREPVMQALTNLQAIGQEHGCDAIIAVQLMHYPTTAGPAVVAYGTGVRFLPAPPPAGETNRSTGTAGAAGGGPEAARPSERSGERATPAAGPRPAPPAGGASPTAGAGQTAAPAASQSS